MSDKTIRILLIEDNPGDARFIREVLADTMMADPSAPALDLTCARRLSSGLKRLARGGFDVVLLDLSLPDSQGLDTFVKTYAQASGVPIIVLSGLVDKEVALEAVQKGAQDYLIKGETGGGLLVRAIRYAIERKRAEEALRTSEWEYRFITEKMTDTVWLMDMELKPTFISPSVTHTLGYTLEELRALSLDELLTPASLEFARKIVATELSPERLAPRPYERSVTLELEFRRKDGSALWSESTITLLRDSEGRPTGLMGVGRDITERKRAEETLRESEEKFRTLAEQSPNMIFINQRGKVLYANKRCEEIMGYTREEFYSTDFDFAAIIAPEYVDLVKTKFAQHMRGEDVTPYEYALITKDGERIEAIIAPRLIDYGGETAILGVVTDITERRRAEEGLRESEEKYRQLFELESDALFLIDNETGRILEVNNAASDLYGYSREELLTKKNTDLSAEPEDTQRVTQTTPVLADQVVSIPLRFHRKRDGTVFPVEITGRFFIRQGRPVHIAAIRDIIERKQAEEALRITSNAVASSISAIAIAEFAGNLTHVNLSFLRMWGYDDESQVLGRPATEFWQSKEEARRVIEALHNGDSFIGELVAKRKDGSLFDVQLLASTVADETGKPVCMMASFVDITRRKQAEAERGRLLWQVQEQAHRVQQIMDTVPEGLLLLDSNCHVLLANPLGKKDLATLAGAQVGDTLTRLGDRPLAEFLTSPPRGLWHEVVTASRFFQAIARPIEDGPTPKGWVLVIRDMTQQYAAERRAQQQERLAAVGQLAAGIAHDFNNIMAVITLYAGMLARTPDLPAKVYERLGTIHQQALRASDLVQQILDFSRRAVLERGPLDLVVFIKEQVKLLERTLPESIKIELVYGRDEYVVNGDPTRLQQAVMNLAANARDAMPEGGRLRIDLERMRIEDAQQAPLPDMPAGEWVRVAVSDTGVGIPPEALSHLFEPFFTTKSAGDGTGLGLAQVYGIVRQHEGYIDVKTRMGEGTTFMLYLPALAVPRPQTPSLEAEQLVPGHGETILTVEDDAATRRAVVSSLEMLGYRVLEAANGQDALTTFEQHASEIRLVLSDVVMPEMGGQALFQALKQRDPAVKVVLMTGHPLEGQIESLRAQGLDGWLPKPPSMERLAEVVAQVLEATEGRPS
jgi:PAS domain S-box-containing protein